MSLIETFDLEFSTGTKQLFSDVSVRVDPGDRIGLIGPNGAGKTTFIKLILGQLDDYAGTLRLKKNLAWGYVKQNPEPADSSSLLQYLLKEWTSFEKDLVRAENDLAENPDSKKQLKLYEQSLLLFEKAGGYEAPSRAEKLIRSLGMDNDINQSAGSLSGGELSLLTFARALLAGPELLILDEPGNHLDYLGLAWLEGFLQMFQGALLIVSHNRYLLDKVCRRLWSLEEGRWQEFSGSYSEFRRERFRELIDAQHEHDAAGRRIDKLERKVKELNSIVSSQYNPPKTLSAQLAAAKRKLADEKNARKELPRDAGTIKMKLRDSASKGKIALEINGFTLSRGDQILLDSFSLNLDVGQKAALLGANGSGKTSLLEDILEKAEWDKGLIRIGPGLKVGYLSQKAQFTASAETVMDEVRSWGALSEDEAVRLTAPFLFKFEDRFKPLSVLSGGECNRLQLARLIYLKCDFLILDEPTNHMDIGSREVIGDTLDKFDGTLLLVSHDRYFLDRLIDRVFEIRDKKLFMFEGNFTRFFKARYPVLPRMTGRISERKKIRSEAPDEAQQGRAGDIERRISESEALKISLEKQLENALKYKKTDRGKTLSEDLKKLESRLEKLYMEWESVI